MGWAYDILLTMDNRTPGHSIPDFSPDPPAENRFNMPSEGEKDKYPAEKRKGFFWTKFSLIGLILLKLKNLLIFLKFAKFGMTAISMAATVWIYALFMDGLSAIIRTPYCPMR